MKLIRNADDYGKSESVTNAILSCFADGSIDRTTLMVNMPDAKRAVELAGERGLTDKIGLHLNLTEGLPLTEPIRSNPLFCDKDGYYHALFRQRLKYRLYMDEQSKEQIYTELKAQLELYRELGLTLWHIDSHHHVHTDLPIYSVLRKLAGEYDFASVRLSRNLYIGGNFLNRIYKSVYNRSLRKICHHTTNLFGSSKDYKAYFEAQNQKELPDACEVEIMLHPMYNSEGVLVDTDTPMEDVKIILKQA